MSQVNQEEAAAGSAERKLAFIHPLADVGSTKVGDRSTIWQFVVVLERAQIGSDVNICSHCFVENDVIVGDRVTIKNGVQLWDGLRIGDDVFIGPNVTFTNDKHPRSKVYPEAFAQTRVEKGASIGAGATILPGLVIGEGAMIGAGAVVTKSVPPYALVTGSPARVVRYVDTLSSPGVQVPRSADKPVSAGVGGVTLHPMQRISNDKGHLSVGEFSKDVPFAVKRYFLIYEVPASEVRGGHAHRKCEQFLICVKGSCSVLVDDGRDRLEITLDSPSQGLYLPPMIWGVQYRYSADAVLLVFASDYYDEGDYIRDYEEFKRLV